MVKIERGPTDGLDLRATIRGSEEIGYHLTWCGEDPHAVVAMLKDVLTIAEQVLPYAGDT